MRNVLLLVLMAAVLVGRGGCATATRPQTVSDIPPQRIGIVLNTSSRPGYNVPAKGAGAGAALGAGAGLGAARSEIGVILMPFAVVIGAIIGAANAEDAARVEEAESTIKGALSSLKPAEVVRDRVIEVGRSDTRHSLAALAGPLDIEGVDTVLELAVQEFSLRGDGQINPPFSLILGVRTRVIRAADGTQIHEEMFEAKSQKLKFVEWAANNAQPLRDELDRAALALARDIVAGILRRDVSRKSEEP